MNTLEILGCVFLGMLTVAVAAGFQDWYDRRKKGNWTETEERRHRFTPHPTCDRFSIRHNERLWLNEKTCEPEWRPATYNPTEVVKGAQV